MSGGTLKKSSITLDGVPLSASGSFVWRFQAGVQPYQAVFSTHSKLWWTRLRRRMGEALTLKVTDARGETITVENLYILHVVPNNAPHQTAFVVSDLRWKWPYKLITRDYNIPKKTGDRTAKNTVPVEKTVVVDEYDYKPYSLNQGERWLARDAVEDVLKLLVKEDEEGGGKKKGGKKKKKGGKGKKKKKKDEYVIESFPIDKGEEKNGEFTLQNIILRDSGDSALARLLSYIPGSDVYVNAQGKIVIFDAANLHAGEVVLNKLPPATWEGEKVEMVDRTQIRPEKIRVHYQREVEVLLDFSDDYGGTSAHPPRNSPFMENVLPTVDPETEIQEYDPEVDAVVKKKIPPGTWLRVDRWLEAMDKIKPQGSAPWTFDTIKVHWVAGDLDGMLGGRGLDLDEKGNVSMRIQALKQHFRQTFRINRRYMERIRDIAAIRVALLDPVTGARAPAAVWGQACVVPSNKGKLMAARKNPDAVSVYRNVDYLAPSKDPKVEVTDTSPGPAQVTILDRDLGILRLSWILSPYGTVESFIPSLLVGERGNKPQVPQRNLAHQDQRPVGAGLRVATGSNGIFLRDTSELKILLTIVPAAPNNLRQFHVEEVEASDISPLFRNNFRIQSGKGPVLSVFIPPGEATARFAWKNERRAVQTLESLLGFNSEDLEKQGLESSDDMDGFQIVNKDRELKGHSQAVAAEILAPFADAVQGRVVSRVPSGKNPTDLKGNISSITVTASAAPSSKVRMVYEFPGRQRPLNRLAVLPEATRHLILGILPLPKGDK